MNTTKVLFLALCFVGAAALCRENFCQSGEVADSLDVKVLLAIKQRNLDVLEKLFWEVSDPTSSQYGKFLSHDEVGALTSNPEMASEVAQFFIKRGVTEVSVTGHGDFVELKANVRVIERLFNAKYLEFTHNKKPVKIFRSLEATIPEAVADKVDFISHISNFPVISDIQMTKMNKLRATTDALVDPAVIQQAYGIQQASQSGLNNSMAVFETTQDYSSSDLSTFEQKFNVPSQKVANVIGPNTGWICMFDPNSCGEASLDVQYIIGVANGVPLTYWSIASSVSDPFYAWIQAVASTAEVPLVHSMSYGTVEQEMDATTVQRTNTEFQKMGVRGLTIVIASGDDGCAGSSARGDTSKCGFNPSWPATSPYITAVGATQFKDGSASAGEIPCQSDNAPASLITSGGGFSAIFSAPAYQTDAISTYFSTASSLPPTTDDPTQFPSPGFNKAGRGYPDVAALGHNYQVVISGSVYKVDGTSCAAPVFAGMMALINGQRLANGGAPVGFINPMLYKLASTNPEVYTSISTGNDACTAKGCCSKGFVGAKGWDPLSGLGTVNFEALAAAF